jgi:signal recognition particle receptor subunit beta
MKTLTYTFRTFPFKEKIPSAFVFGKLNEDFKMFSNKILIERPDLIVGIANNSNNSRFEKLTINRFNKIKKISRNGPDSFELNLPPNPSFSISINTTDSFCNWTTYKIKEFLKNNSLNTKLIFVHINEKDLNKLSPILCN